MGRWRWFVVPFVAVAAVAGLAAAAWSVFVDGPCESYADVDFFDLDPSVRCVRTTGTAHYEVVITQRVPGNGFFEDKTYYVFGLFPPGNTTEREIRILVRTERQPERLVSYETMTIEGALLRMDHRKIPFDTERRLGERSSYFFADRVYLLEPDRIEVDGEQPWVRP